MAITTSTAVKNNQADNFAGRYASGVLTIRSGSPPGPNNAATGTVLATMALPNPAFAASSGGTVAKSGTWQDSSADAGGTAGHFRVVRSTDNGATNDGSQERWEGTVTATGNGGDMTLDNIVIALGQSITINTTTVTQA